MLLEASNLSKVFRMPRGRGGKRAELHAVNNVSFDIDDAETVALVGESGCGKSTTGLATIRLIEPTSGTVSFESKNLLAADSRELRSLRADLQIVFQDPRGQLDSRMRVASTVGEPLRAHRMGNRTERRDRTAEVLETVGLGKAFLDRYPHQLSGGQRQRVAIARALAPRPKLVMLDEVVSALDVSIQTQVLNLLLDLQQQLGVSYLFISHDMAAVSYLADRVVVMYLGRTVESAPMGDFVTTPAHPYSQALLSAVPDPRPSEQRERIVLTGDIPSPTDPPSGCAFHTRCPHAQPKCAEVVPTPIEIGERRQVSCHYPLI